MSNLSGFVKRIRDIMRNDAGINGDAQRIEQIAWMLFLKVYDTKEQDWEMDDDYKSIIPEECRWANWAHDETGKGMTGDTLLNFVNNTLFPTLKALPVNVNTPIKKAIVQTTFADANNYMKDYLLGMRRTFIKMGEGGAQPNISKEKIVNTLVPLPPLAEQKRIVAKLEELLPLCEKLK